MMSPVPGNILKIKDRDFIQIIFNIEQNLELEVDTWKVISTLSS